MKTNIVIGGIQEQAAQAIVVNLFEGVEEPGGATGAVDAALGGQIQALIAGGDFRGKAGEVAVLYPGEALPAKRVILVGLGKSDDFDAEGVRRAAAAAAKKARSLGVTELHTITHGAGVGGLAPEDAAAATVEGTILGLYRFHELKTKLEDVRPDIETLTLVEFDAERQAALESGARRGQILAESTNFTRDLVNRPANIATPEHLAEQARQIAEAGGMAIQVLDREGIEALEMHAFLSVAQGGGAPPRLIILEHNADRDDLPTVALVGKGITFDTGGISIKPSQDMGRMKGDMAGGAAVLGAMRAVSLLDLPLRVVGLVPATENMPDANATKPGDVVGSRKGLTIEIINTDAEGRMLLVDALTYTEEFGPDAVFDMATLTGSHVIALGTVAAAAMGDDGLIEKLRAAGETMRERVWPLPLFKEYDKQLKSEVADTKHLGGRPAGAITAGYFLSKFTPDDVPWVHIDMAGMEIIDKGENYTPTGATGYGVRLFVEMLRTW